MKGFSGGQLWCTGHQARSKVPSKSPGTRPWLGACRAQPACCTNTAKQELRSRLQPFREEQGVVAILLLLALLRRCQGTSPTSPSAAANDRLLAAFQRAPEGVRLLREQGGGEKRLALCSEVSLWLWEPRITKKRNTKSLTSLNLIIRGSEL